MQKTLKYSLLSLLGLGILFLVLCFVLCPKKEEEEEALEPAADKEEATTDKDLPSKQAQKEPVEAEKATLAAEKIEKAQQAFLQPQRGSEAKPIFPLKLGSEGPEVAALQDFLATLLKEKGYKVVWTDCSKGTFDENTEHFCKLMLGTSEVEEDTFKRKTFDKRKIANFLRKKYESKK